MKIQCDVCSREEASVFCTADEAALCHGCDSKVHHANKLASKHQRFSLLHPSSLKEAPRCEICQERRAFVFCQEDRAILCRECDLSIHTTNHLTQKHNRFLLTGIKLSSSFPSISSPSDGSFQQAMKDSKEKKKNKKKEEASNEMGSSLPLEKMANTCSNSSQGSKSEDLWTSSISEYLIEMLPGWHVEDLLASSTAPVDGPCETDGFSDLELVSKDFSMWVPQVAPISGLLYYPAGGALDPKNGVGSKDFKERRWINEDGFTVPEVRPPPYKKRSRPLWVDLINELRSFLLLQVHTRIFGCLMFLLDLGMLFLILYAL